MKALKCFLVLSTFVGLMLVGCSDESQSPVSPTDQASLEKKATHYFTMTDMPLEVGTEGIVYLPNGNVKYKKRWIKELITCDDPFLAGIMEHYLSTMIDAETGDGAVHGSFITTPNDPDVKGNWEGKYVGYRSYIGEENVDLSAFGLPDGLYHVWTLPLKLEGHGKGGKIDKYQIFMTSTLTIYGLEATFPEPVFWRGSGSGFYKEH